MSYQDTYEAWLNSRPLSAQEKAELESIRTDEKEKESRFFDPSCPSAPPACGALWAWAFTG